MQLGSCFFVLLGGKGDVDACVSGPLEEWGPRGVVMRERERAGKEDVERE